MKTLNIACVFLASAAAQAQINPIQIIDEPTSTVIPTTLVMGSTGILATYRLINPSPQNISITGFTILDSTTSTPAFGGLVLWSGNTPVAGANAAFAAHDGRGWMYEIHFFSEFFLIPPNNSITLVLRGNAASYASGAAQDGSTHQFQVVGGFAYGVPIRVLRSNLFLETTTNSSTNGTVMFTAHLAGDVVLNKVTITFGTERDTPAFLNSNDISLVDANNQDVAFTGAAFTIVNGNTITWYFSQGFVISAGASVSFRLKSRFPVRAKIASAMDVGFADGLDTAAIEGLNLSPWQSPVRITDGR